MQSLIRSAFALLLASGAVMSNAATSAQPAEAGVVVSIGFGGGGYAPVYRPYPRPYAHYHRRYVPARWARPIYPAYRYPAYGRAYGAGYPSYGRPYGAGYARYGDDYGRGVGRGHDYGRRHDHGYVGRPYQRNS